MKRARLIDDHHRPGGRFGASAFGSPAGGDTLVISHVMKGCHVWALNDAAPFVN